MQRRWRCREDGRVCECSGAGAAERPGGSANAGRTTNARSREWRPGDLRHTVSFAESCCLPALTRFTSACCTGPDRHTPERALRFSRYPSPPDPAPRGARLPPSGEQGGLPERPNGHAWKACEVQASVGSNPTPSASHDTPGPTGSGVSSFSATAPSSMRPARRRERTISTPPAMVWAAIIDHMNVRGTSSGRSRFQRSA